MTKTTILYAALFLALALTIPVTAQTTFEGCYECKTDYGDCYLLTGTCAQRCNFVGHEETGQHMCTEWEDIPPNTACVLDGNSCFNVEAKGDGIDEDDLGDIEPESQ